MNGESKDEYSALLCFDQHDHVKGAHCQLRSIVLRRAKTAWRREPFVLYQFSGPFTPSFQ